MTHNSGRSGKKIGSPATHFESPGAVVEDMNLSLQEKREVLAAWEQDARQLLTASNEGMTGSDVGATRDDNHQFGQVVRAIEQVGEKPKHKPSQ